MSVLFASEGRERRQVTLEEPRSRGQETCDAGPPPCALLAVARHYGPCTTELHVQDVPAAMIARREGRKLLPAGVNTSRPQRRRKRSESAHDEIGLLSGSRSSREGG